MPWLPLCEPSIGNREFSQLIDALLNGWNNKSHVTRFEQNIARYTGSHFAMATSSCTGALHMAMRALGLGPGDEVIVPETTWVATAAAVVYCGATPILVDVDPTTWCMDPASAGRAINAKTKAILPVHQCGTPADISAILSLAKEHDLYVIEDAAAAIGSTIAGKQVGTFGDAGAFSFHSTKMLTTGEGGMLVTNDEQLFERVSSIARHGQDPKNPWRAMEFGVNYKMSHLQAAVGLGQLERIEELVDKKRAIHGWYESELGNIEGITLLRQTPGTASNYWLNAAMLDDDIDRNRVIELLKSDGIDGQPAAVPLSSLPMFTSHETSNPVAYRIAKQGILLPSSTQLGERDIRRVCSSLTRALANDTIHKIV
ncbi:MAG TPA: DegT/DnrJ/EryC1/StrS family aminotransferase [Tepidisphaeraceae bacterium]|nr:DegT/DnrJ/EryC1/StrS family aminotransferase [Tepidisphaeraceae bacterium]